MAELTGRDASAGTRNAMLQRGPFQRHRHLLACLLLAVASGVLAGCSSGAANVLVVNENLSVTLNAHTDELIDVNVPLENDTSHVVRLVRIQLAGEKGVRLISTAAYNENRSGEEFTSDLGDLPKECPRKYPANAPISAAVLRPHQLLWFAVATVVIARPGRYHIARVKITYSTNGHQGWQYQNTWLTVTVKNPPRPGPRPKVTAGPVC